MPKDSLIWKTFTHPEADHLDMGEGKFAGQKLSQGAQSASESLVNHCNPGRGDREVTSDEGPFRF